MTPPRKTHKRRSSRETKRQLRSIYEGLDGKVPDLTKLDRRGRSKMTSVLLKIIGLLAVLSVVAWVGFFLFTQGLFQADETMKIEIEGPEDVKSGEEVAYTLRYENIGDVPVASLIAKLNIPSTFHVYSTVPEPDENLEWTIGSLSAGSDGAITITGVFLADVPSSQRLQALFTYKPANFSSDFQDIITQKIDINDSVLAFTFTGPEKALAGDSSEYIINVQNSGADPVYNLRITPTFTEDFTVISAQPAREEGQTYWAIDSLDPGELKAITVSGSFTSTASGDQTLSVSAGFVEQDVVYTQRSEEITTDVLAGSLSFSVIVNGSNEDQTADLGETLRMSIDYANNSREAVQDMSFSLTLTGIDGTVPINWKNANLGGGERIENEISWEQLDDLEPETSAVIDLSLPLFPRIDPGEADSFTMDVVLTLNKIGSISSTRTLQSSPITIRLNSDAGVSAQARYYSNDGTAIGSGPLPPEVGQITNYRVYWNTSNSLHTLEDVRLSTTLPQDVTWIENTDTDIGSISYNSTTRIVTWAITKLPAELGHAGAWFEIAVNPDDADIGRFIKLTNTTSFEAKDTVTNESLSKSLGELTSELPNDEFALGQGVVIN